MYAGNIVEKCPTETLFKSPRHPYTRGLFDAIPRIDAGRDRLVPIPGTVPQPGRMPDGCAFAPRCSHASELCHNKVPPLLAFDDERATACFHPLGEPGVAPSPDAAQTRQGVQWA
jgi:peptide/nickel transport system ATP-binding protein